MLFDYLSGPIPVLIWGKILDLRLYLSIDSYSIHFSLDNDAVR